MKKISIINDNTGNANEGWIPINGVIKKPFQSLILLEKILGE